MVDQFSVDPNVFSSVSYLHQSDALPHIARNQQITTRNEAATEPAKEKQI